MCHIDDKIIGVMCLTVMIKKVGVMCHIVDKIIGVMCHSDDEKSWSDVSQ